MILVKNASQCFHVFFDEILKISVMYLFKNDGNLERNNNKNTKTIFSLNMKNLNTSVLSLNLKSVN